MKMRNKPISTEATAAHFFTQESSSTHRFEVRSPATNSKNFESGILSNLNSFVTALIDILLEKGSRMWVPHPSFNSQTRHLLIKVQFCGAILGLLFFSVYLGGTISLSVSPCKQDHAHTIVRLKPVFPNSTSAVPFWSLITQHIMRICSEMLPALALHHLRYMYIRIHHKRARTPFVKKKKLKKKLL